MGLCIFTGLLVTVAGIVLLLRTGLLAIPLDLAVEFLDTFDFLLGDCWYCEAENLSEVSLWAILL